MTEYGPTTTAGEVVENVDLTGSVAVVTGAGGGLGRETAQALASAGATVVLTARSTEKARAAASRILEAVPHAKLEVLKLNLADLTSVTTAVDELRGQHRRIDILVNNAGVMYSPLLRTTQGFELQFGTNHLGHFLLTTSLLPALQAGAERSGTPSRVVAISSDAHLGHPVDLVDPNFLENPYDKFAAYGQSKAANVLMVVEIEKQCAANGVNAYAVHPVCVPRSWRGTWIVTTSLR